MKCNHDVAEMVTACMADGLCPLCLAADVNRLSRALDEILKYCIEDGDDVGTIALIRDTADKALAAAL